MQVPREAPVRSKPPRRPALRLPCPSLQGSTHGGIAGRTAWSLVSGPGQRGGASRGAPGQGGALAAGRRHRAPTSHSGPPASRAPPAVFTPQCTPHTARCRHWTSAVRRLLCCRCPTVQAPQVRPKLVRWRTSLSWLTHPALPRLLAPASAAWAAWQARRGGAVRTAAAQRCRRCSYMRQGKAMRWSN